MLWIKAFHLIAMVSWFAGIFYLPRLFVYHAMSLQAGNGDQQFKTMERKLFNGIMTPAAIVTVILGFVLMSGDMSYYIQQGWFHAKLLLVGFVLIYHGVCWLHLRKFADNNNLKSHTYFRFFNEVPVLMLIAIIVLVVVKPF